MQACCNLPKASPNWAKRGVGAAALTDSHTETRGANAPKPRRIEMFGRGFDLPRGRGTRIALGVALIAGGVLGFLPILGFWMIPLGLFVLSLEFSAIRRLRRRLIVRFAKRRKPAA